MRLNDVQGTDVAILNVYASNSIGERYQLWQELIDTLPTDCKWILAGDWNFVSNQRDKTSECRRLVSGVEAGIFVLLLDLLQVQDEFPSSNRIRFSWDNRRRSGLRVLARLDRIYTFNVGGSASAVEEYFILGNSSHSDHLPVWYRITLQQEPKRKSAYKMSAFFLKDPIVKEAFKRIWGAHTQLGFFGKVRRCVKFYREFCIQKAQERRRREDMLRTGLSLAMEELQTDPSD